MNADTPQDQRRKTTIKRWLPIFIIAAIFVNLGALSIIVDILNITFVSFTQKVFDAPSVHPSPLLFDAGRTVGNSALIVAFLLLIIKDYQERK